MHGIEQGLIRQFHEAAQLFEGGLLHASALTSTPPSFWYGSSFVIRGQLRCVRIAYYYCSMILTRLFGKIPISPSVSPVHHPELSFSIIVIMSPL